MKLYSYFRSSASYRVRIALALKGLQYEYLPVHLLKSEQLTDEFRRLNPDGLLPVLVDGENVLTQSLAICEYLEETHPHPALLPSAPADRAHVRALALIVACEIHPLNNLRVLRYLVRQLGVAEEAKDQWYRHWVESGLAAMEAKLVVSSKTGDFCFGDSPTLADLCLVPQIFNARRLNSDLTRMPTILRIYDRCLELEAFRSAAPENQPDTAQ